jgi:hypothetical protein
MLNFLNTVFRKIFGSESDKVIGFWKAVGNEDPIVIMYIWHDIVTCRKGRDLRVSDWIIGFIYILYTALGTTGNYIAIANLHTLLFTVTYTLGFSNFTSRILATDFITVSLSLQITRISWHFFFFLANFFPFLLDSRLSHFYPKLISCQNGVSKLS